MRTAKLALDCGVTRSEDIQALYSDHLRRLVEEHMHVLRFLLPTIYSSSSTHTPGERG